MSPPVSPAFTQSVSLRLLVTCGHVCMTKEMQSLAQTITICLVCTIYMKYIFIYDMHAHEIASVSVSPCLSYAFTQSVLSLRMCCIQKHWYHLCVLFRQSCLILPINAPGSHHFCCSKKELLIYNKKGKRFYFICFGEGVQAGGKCIFSSNVIIVAR